MRRLAFPDADDPRLRRASVHARATPASGLHDELAEAGAYLFILGCHEVDGRPTARIELPLFAGVALFWPSWRASRKLRWPAR
jgi:hypothetical protein